MCDNKTSRDGRSADDKAASPKEIEKVVNELIKSLPLFVAHLLRPDTKNCSLHDGEGKCCSPGLVLNFRYNGFATYQIWKDGAMETNVKFFGMLKVFQRFVEDGPVGICRVEMLGCARHLTDVLKSPARQIRENLAFEAGAHIKKFLLTECKEDIMKDCPVVVEGSNAAIADDETSWLDTAFLRGCYGDKAHHNKPLPSVKIHSRYDCGTRSLWIRTNVDLCLCRDSRMKLLVAKRGHTAEQFAALDLLTTMIFGHDYKDDIRYISWISNLASTVETAV